MLRVHQVHVIKKELGIEVERIESPDKTSGYRIRVNNSREGEIRAARYRGSRDRTPWRDYVLESSCWSRARARARFLYRTSSPRRSARICRGEGERKRERAEGEERKREKAFFRAGISLENSDFVAPAT